MDLASQWGRRGGGTWCRRLQTDAACETYILGLIQRRSPPARPTKPRTSLGPEARAVARQSSLCRKDPPYIPEERHACYPRLAGIRCGALDPSSSEAECYQNARSPSSDELVNAQYIPAQPCRAQTAAHRTHAAPKPTISQLRAAAKKCRFTEDKIAQKKPGRKACRAQSENSLLGQRERKYNTMERDAQAKTRRGSGHRRWRSTLELSQDEAETPPEQPIRRSRKPRVYAQPHLHHHHHHQLPPDGYALRESESSLSEAESPGSSSLSSDSDESGGLVWPQQLRPQLAPPSPSHPPQPKAFVKIKASHALKKKILRFRSGSLKVMTTVWVINTGLIAVNWTQFELKWKTGWPFAGNLIDRWSNQSQHRICFCLANKPDRTVRLTSVDLNLKNDALISLRS